MIEGDLFQDAGAPQQKDIKTILFSYLRYWYLFLIGAALCLGAAVVHLRYYVIPYYNISGTMLIKNERNGGGVMEAAAFSDISMLRSVKNTDDEVELIKSRSLMYRALSELALNTTYYRKGRVHDVELYGQEVPIRVIINKLEPAAYGKTFAVEVKNNNTFLLSETRAEDKIVTTEHKLGQQVVKPYGSFTVVAATDVAAVPTGQEILIRFHNIQDLAAGYSQGVNVSYVNEFGNVVAISLSDAVGAKGVDIVNKLMEVYEKDAIENKNISANNTVKFIDERLSYLTSELHEVEKGVEEYKRKNELTDVTSEASLAQDRASEYNKQLSDFEIQIDVLNSIEKYLRKQENQYELVPSTLTLQDPTLQNLMARFNELQMERQRMLRATQPNNPIVLNMNEQLANLRINILENLRNIKSGLLVTRNKLVAGVNAFESRVRRVPTIERELLDINRQQSIKQNLYLYLLQKREEAALSQAVAVSNSRIIDAATASGPIGPNKMSLYLMSLLAGLGIPLMFLFVKDLLNDKVQHLKEVERSTATPILGEVMHHNVKESVVVTPGNRSSIAEMFRHIRSNLQFATVGKENKVILVTSSMSGEGKTFFSINLAASLVLTGKRVVVLGMDLRKPRLLHALDLPIDGKGISNYLVTESVTVDDIVVPSGVMPDLYVAGSGPVPPNPAELMMSPRMEKLLDVLKESFDYIIIDTAPVGLVTDAYNLTAYVDSTIYVVRYNYTHKAQLDIVDKIYHHKKLNHPMIVLNDAKKQNSYGYGYGYGGYGEEKKKSFFQRKKEEV